MKVGCYICSREFTSLERLNTHICVRHFQDGRNGGTPNTPSAIPVASGSSHTGNGLLHNNARQSILYSARNITPRPSTITRPHEFRLQTEPTDLTTRLDMSTGATIMKRRRLDSEIVTIPYGRHDHTETCICPSCGSPHQNFHSFIRHMETHLTRLNNHLIICPACGDTSDTIETYTTHCFDHYIVQSSGYCCTICRILFQSEEESVTHYQDNHVIALYRCVVCGEVLENNVALQVMHIKSFWIIFSPWFHSRYTTEGIIRHTAATWRAKFVQIWFFRTDLLLNSIFQWFTSNNALETKAQTSR